MLVTTTMAKRIGMAAVAAAVTTGGVVVGSGSAGAVSLPDVSVSKNLLPFGCQAVVTNLGGATARDVVVHEIPFGATQGLGDIAPGQTKSASYIDCAMVFFGIRVYVTTSNGDSNPFNNVARIYP
ncbi:hypothetical protein [Williamsia sterculiae]|uniref:Uncharacterized protein n=1 Tax=Williamsia sterculiae TaxID=1344003 RepID=A0A1N7ERA0_9NOCA|nr:hypothetical protein [Williamsia sterculiae]SIR90638.1 hypothetical protein SAMN05445060_1601 [Williamsia sterculiae]